MVAGVSVVDKDFVFKNRLQSFSIVNHGYKDPSEFFAAVLEEFIIKMEKTLKEHPIVVVGACILGEFVKVTIDGEGEEHDEKQNLYHHTNPAVVDFETDLQVYFNESVVTAVYNKIEESKLRGSGFTLHKTIELNIQIGSFEPLAGSSYIKLPKFLSNKKAIINVQNNDQMCFQYAILSALYPPENNAQRAQNYTRYIDCY